jgi:tRNA A37 threonylcarbamoyladenosine dehydratase
MKIETVSYQVKWSKFRKGYSFFVPCIDHRAAKKSMLAVAERLKMNVVTKVVIEDGIKGLRVWRV